MENCVIHGKNESLGEDHSRCFSLGPNLDSGLELSSLPIKINAWFSDIDPPHSLALWSSSADIIVTSSKACL
jgi:hypothetical protein